LWRKLVFKVYGPAVYPGKLEELPTFRIANIGEITCKDDIEEFLEVLEIWSIDFLAKEG
jgi:hypothetical protein